MTNQIIRRIQRHPFGNYPFHQIDQAGEEKLPAYQIASVFQRTRLLQQAFQQSLLSANNNHSWIAMPSVRASLLEQVGILGDVRRDHGDISFLTHVMEVTDRVFNTPELNRFNPEHKAFAAASHDIEDITKGLGVQPQWLRRHFLKFVAAGAHRKDDIETSLYLLMDPPTVLGNDRVALQISRVVNMGPIEVYVRLFDKICTYKRDLYNIRTRNPETGKPYLDLASITANKPGKTVSDIANQQLERLFKKNEVVRALPVAFHYKREWAGIYSALRQEIRQQLRDNQVNPDTVDFSAAKYAFAYRSNGVYVNAMRPNQLGVGRQRRMVKIPA